MTNRNLLMQTYHQLAISNDRPSMKCQQLLSTLSGVLLNFDVSGAKFALPDEEWNAQPENILVGLPAGI